MKNGDLDYGQVSFLIFSKKYTVLGTKKKEPYFHEEMLKFKKPMTTQTDRG